MKNKLMASLLLLLPITSSAQPLPMGPALRALAKAPVKRTTVKIAPAKAPTQESPDIDAGSSYNYFHMMAETNPSEPTLVTMRDAVLDPKPPKNDAKKPVKKAETPAAPVVPAP